MRRSMTDIRDGPYRSERERISEERQKRQIAAETAQKSLILQRAEMEQAEKRAETKILFALLVTLDRKLEELEVIRDANEPTSQDENWNDTFCRLLPEIHELKELCRDVWFEYVASGKQ